MVDLLRSLDDPAERQRVQLGVQVWAEALRSPQVRAVVCEGVDRARLVVAEQRRLRPGRRSCDRGVDDFRRARLIHRRCSHSFRPMCDIRRTAEAKRKRLTAPGRPRRYDLGFRVFAGHSVPFVMKR